MEQTRIDALAGKLITFNRDTRIFIFHSPDMDSGHTSAVPAGETLMLSGTAWAEAGEFVWFGIASDYLICLHASDVEQVRMDDGGGSLGSFLGRLQLPFALPVTDGAAGRMNRLLKWAIAALCGVALFRLAQER